MVEIKFDSDALWARIERALEKAKTRLRRTAESLNAAGVQYAVIGDHAVQHWVAQIDESAVRNARDVDILLNRGDLPRAVQAMKIAGFIYQLAAETPMFLDGQDGKARDAVRVIFAGEKLRDDYPEPTPRTDDFEMMDSARTLPLEALVKLNLLRFRSVDRVHLQDMISVALIDQSWLGRLSPELGSRLKGLLDNPDG